MKTKVEYALQAYIGSSPSSPRWVVVSFHAIEGHKKYAWWEAVDGYSTRKHDPRLVDDGFSTWKFVDAAAGVSVLRELRKIPQKFYLRVARVVTIEDVFPIAGADIEDRTLVDGPDKIKAGVRDPFWGHDPEDFKNIVPANKIKDIVYGRT